MKPYQFVTIQESGDPLVEIPLEQFAVTTPHPYVRLGAPYGNYSPYFLRQQVLTQLTQAQIQLQTLRPGWQLKIFDAYRPLSVQQFMVDHAFRDLAIQSGIDPSQIDTLSPERKEQLYTQVSQFWATPSHNPATPPPHSTGGAIDLTLADASGNSVDMGSPIDELSPRSYPEHFSESTDPAQQQAHQHRTLLKQVMTQAKFKQHPNEWWHFSLGDQLWAWQMGNGAIARYGNPFNPPQPALLD